MSEKEIPKSANILSRGMAWLNWTLGTFFVVVIFAMQSAYAIINPYVANDLGLSLVQVGIVGSIYTWVFAFAQFSSGALLDRFGIKNCIPKAALLVTVGIYIFSKSTTLEYIILSQVLIALGASFGFVGAGFIGKCWFPPIKYGMMFSLVQLVSSSGAVLSQQTISSILSVGYCNWREIIFVVALSSLVVTILMFSFLRDPYDISVGNIKRKVNLLSIIKSLKNVYFIPTSKSNAIVGGILFGIMFAVGVVWGPRIVMARGIEGGVANTITAICWLGLATGAPCISWISSYFGQIRLFLAICIVIQLTCVLSILFFNLEIYMFGILFYLLGFSAAGSMLSFTYGALIVPSSLIGTSAAFVNGTQFVLGGVFMAIPGKILSMMATSNMAFGLSILDYRIAMAIFPISLILAIIFVFRLDKNKVPQAI